MQLGAKLLGISRNTLTRYIVHLGIEKPNRRPKAARPGRRLSEIGVLAKRFGIDHKSVRQNGLDRPMSRLALRARLNQIKSLQKSEA